MQSRNRVPIVWDLEAGIWTLEADIGRLESGGWNFKAASWNQETEGWMLNKYPPSPLGRQAEGPILHLSGDCLGIAFHPQTTPSD